VIGSITYLAILSCEANGQGNEVAPVQRKQTVTAQESDSIQLNNTDWNYTYGQFQPNINITIAPRIIIEYGDYATTQALNSSVAPFQISPRIIIEYADTALQLGINAPLGLNTTEVTPRIIVEYADYATCMLPSQSYPGPDPVAISISSPVENPQDGIVINTNKTISFNVTSPLSPIENVTLYYETSLNPTWQNITVTYALASNVTSATPQIVIPGQSQPCNVTFKIEAHNYQGNYVVNDNTGQYYVYNVAVSEFPSVLILPLLMIPTLIGAIIHRKRSHPSDN
jgi:hypothetical protein